VVANGDLVVAVLVVVVFQRLVLYLVAIEKLSWRSGQCVARIDRSFRARPSLEGEWKPIDAAVPGRRSPRPWENIGPHSRHLQPNVAIEGIAVIGPPEMPRRIAFDTGSSADVWFVTAAAAKVVAPAAQHRDLRELR